MTDYTEFLPEVMPYVPNVPDFIATAAIRNAVIEFCEKSRILQIDADPISVVAGIATYQIDAPNGMKIVEIMDAWSDVTHLTPSSPDELTRTFQAMDWRTQKGAPRYYTSVVPDEVILVPVPDQTKPNSLKLRVAIAPLRSSTGVDDFIYENWLEGIAFGARARLYNTPGQSYFDKTSALEFERRFRAAIADARVKVNRGSSRTSLDVEFRRVV